VSASSGRIDGMLVVAGMFLGVLVFMELHPLLEAFHNSTERGVLTLPTLLGLGPGVVVAGVSAAALLSFAAADRIDGGPRASRARRPLAVGALLLGLGAAVPLGTEPRWTGDAAPARDRLSSEALAHTLQDGEVELRVLDVRSAGAFQDFHLPLAESAPLATLGRMKLDPEERIVVYGFGSADGERARVLLTRRGQRRVQVLEGGALDWLRTVMLPQLPVDATPEERRRFEELAELSRYFGGTPGFASESEVDSDLDLDQILGQARRASCGW
jgi:rhodanese-related sulfurtransferase